MMNRERLICEFCNLVSIDSVSFREREMADVVKLKLMELGAVPYEDDAGEIIGGNAGNIYALIKGTLPGLPILFSAHMDTVGPGIGKKAKVQSDGRIVSDKSTVLGADDLAGIVVILEALQVLKENKMAHRDIEVLFPVAEEVYLRGSNVFDFTKIRAKEAYVLDLSGKVGRASLQEPTVITFSVQIFGKASHAGFAPEKGVNAIAIAAAAISSLEQGRIGEETTVNIGCISGGTASNIVSERVKLEGEIRSYSHQIALDQLEVVKQAFLGATDRYNDKITDVETGKGSCEFTDKVVILAYQVDPTSSVVTRFLSVCDELGLERSLTKTFGGSDNNNFIRNGIHGIVLACGMNQVHSTEEYTEVEELVKCGNIVLKLMTKEEDMR